LLGSKDEQGSMHLIFITPIFKDKMECITLCVPRDQSHISQQIKEEYHHIVYYIMIINT
jgi:hypothetical protein